MKGAAIPSKESDGLQIQVGHLKCSHLQVVYLQRRICNAAYATPSVLAPRVGLPVGRPVGCGCAAAVRVAAGVPTMFIEPKPTEETR